MKPPEDYLVFDLETQRDAFSVGGFANTHRMMMSVGVIWDSKRSKFYVYLEDKVEEMTRHLLSGPRVIGFNHIHFDYKVVAGYKQNQSEYYDLLNQLSTQKNLDILADLRERINLRVSLENVAQPTLSIGKTADGLMALKWYGQYKETGDTDYLKKIIHYCIKDVEVTRDIYLYGLQHKSLMVNLKQKGIKRIEVDWSNLSEEDAAKVTQHNLF